MRLFPFRALHPQPALAAEVSSPPYDVMSRAEAAEMAAGNSRSFLHVIRAEIGLADSVDAHADEVYELGARNLARLQADGTLTRDVEPALWLYRLEMDGHAQTGFVGCAAVDDYEAGLIRKHELTRPDKEDDRTRHVDIIGAHTGPVFLTCRAPNTLIELQAQVMRAAEPSVDFIAANGVRHQLWRVADRGTLGNLEDAFGGVDAFYIADGHHRAACAARVRELRRQRGAGPDAGSERFLVVVFPHDQLRILAYNRVIEDLNGHTSEAFLAAVGQRFDVGAPGGSATPASRHAFGMYLDGVWRTLTLKDGMVDEADPIASLDVAVLQDLLLEPVLGIDCPRTNSRISFVGGIRGTAELERNVAANGAGVAFSMFPTSLNELIDVSDAGLVMPPKSTWFEPKLRSGLFVNLLD